MNDEQELPDPASLHDYVKVELGEAMGRRPPLTPLDEAYIAHADAVVALVHQALAGFPLKPRITQELGWTLRDALELRRLADIVMDKAVVVERERGSSWTPSAMRQASASRVRTNGGPPRSASGLCLTVGVTA